MVKRSGLINRSINAPTRWLSPILQAANEGGMGGGMGGSWAVG